MNVLVLAAVVLSATAGMENVGTTLTFEEALSLAGARNTATSTTAPLVSQIVDLRRSRLPNVRAEVAGNTSRTLDLFAEGPLEVRYATSVLAFDYPLWDGGSTNARIGSVEAKLRRVASRTAMDDMRFTQLLDAFGDLYLAQQQSDVLRPLYDRASSEDARTAQLLQSGEISNLTAAERREIVLGFEARLLEVEARRIAAVNSIRLLTGLEAEPRVVVDLTQPSGSAAEATVADDAVKATSVAVEESRARLREVEASSRFRATLSGFAGVGAAESDFRRVHSDGSFGIYGLRVLLTYPLFHGTNVIAIAEAKADVEQSLSARNAARDAARLRAEQYRFQHATAEKRIDLLRQSVAIAKEREDSLQRLAGAGMRSESDLGQAQAERIRREIDLLAAEVERWKAAQLLARMSAAGAVAGQP